MISKLSMLYCFRLCLSEMSIWCIIISPCTYMVLPICFIQWPVCSVWPSNINHYVLILLLYSHVIIINIVLVLFDFNRNCVTGTGAHHGWKVNAFREMAWSFSFQRKLAVLFLSIKNVGGVLVCVLSSILLIHGHIYLIWDISTLRYVSNWSTVNQQHIVAVQSGSTLCAVI